MKLQPPIRYFGSKWRIADWIVARFPAHICYVDVFGGSAATLIRKSRAKVDVYNDIDGEVVAFWRVLRDHPEELARLVEATPYSRAEHTLSFEPSDDPLERARRFVVRSWQTRGGYQRQTHSMGWKFQRVKGRSNAPAAAWTKVPGRIMAVADRMRLVHIECGDWKTIVDRYDSADTLFYLDPPYLRRARAKSNRVYVHEMGAPEKHEELLEHCKQLAGMVVMSSYQDDLYSEQLSGWREFRTIAHCHMGAARTECLWLSPSAVARGLQGDLWA